MLNLIPGFTFFLAVIFRCCYSFSLSPYLIVDAFHFVRMAFYSFDYQQTNLSLNYPEKSVKTEDEYILFRYKESFAL